ncbi:M1 family metallopeptidase, partial [Candidatus Saccharibacteria bacterium]|nr:M1 family metallopeptidase [Candidatus Saccharibacteria bacterium]
GETGPVELEIDRINTQKSFDELRLHTKDQLFAGKYQIEIEFTGEITEPMHGIYPCNFTLKGQKKQLIATQFESHHAREAFPCIDEPEAKATFDLTLITPAGETVIANTPVKAQEPYASQSDGSWAYTYTTTKKSVPAYIRTEFETTPIMSTYLLAFAYGDLGFKEGKTNNNVGVRVYATPDKVELTDFAVDVAKRCLDFFEEYYDTPYPLPKLDLIGLPDFSAGAMENWGLITFRESVLYVDPKSTSIETKQFVAMVIAHEIAHMWFGNLVTMKWWNDLWLNESFANLMEYRAVDALFPEWEIWNEFVRREVGMALSRDSLPNVQAVQVEVNHPDELVALFDPAIVYAKGGSLLNMVRHLIGEDSFRKGLKTYFQEFKYQNTVADDLWNHLGKAASINIEQIMKQWLQKPGFPVLEVEYSPNSVSGNLSQQRLVVSEKPLQDKTLWQVPLAASRQIDKKMLDEKQITFKVNDKTTYPLMFNHDGQSYFVSQYLNNEHFEEILTAIRQGILSPVDRLLLIQSYLLLERAGRVSTLQNIQLLPAYASEREESVWGMMAGIVGNARTLIDKDKALEAKLHGFVRPIVKPLVDELGWQSKPNEPAQIQKLRALALSLAAATEDKAVIKDGLRLFKNFKKPADLAPDIRSVVYFIGVRHGTAADFEKLIKLHNSLTNADEKDEVASELTSTRKPDQIKQLLKMLKLKVRPQDVSHWFAWLMRNRYSTDLTWEWLQQNWDWIQTKFASDKSYDAFPRYVAMVFSYQAQLKQYRAFFEPKTNIALSRSIKLGIEEIEARVAWRQRNEKVVKDWLTNLAQ